MYKYHITFKSSSSHSNADALSRLPTPGRSADPPVPAETVLLLKELSKGPVSVNQINSWTRRYPVLSRELQFILYGWRCRIETLLVEMFGAVNTRWCSVMGKQSHCS